MSQILIVDDEEGIRSFIGEVLEDEGHKVTLAADGAEAAALIDRRGFHLMLTDLKMPRLDGMALLRRARSEQPEMQVIVLTAHGTVDSAVEAMKLGAFDYLSKPISGPAELRLLVERALEHRRLTEHKQRTRAGSRDPDLVARDPAMVPVVDALKKVAATEATVLLVGESGTGKEVAARAVHRWSPRTDGPFVAVNCAVLTDNLLESEMFGHDKGAFTGASSRRRGRIELAEGGTLFLDEIGEMKPGLQAKLLRVLQERRFERVGGQRTLDADVRWIAATNRDLPAEIASGRFREDLYHRLAVFPVRLPPLRERRGDIAHLAEGLLQRAAHSVGRPSLRLADGALGALVGYEWPGNVRELANALERAAILAGGDVIGPEHLVLGAVGLARPVTTAPATAAASSTGTLADTEREAIGAALAAEGGNRKATAARLGIGLRTLYDKIKLYGL